MLNRTRPSARQCDRPELATCDPSQPGAGEDNHQKREDSNWVVDPTHSSIEFAVKHLLIATVRGSFTKFEIDADIDEAQPERSRVEVRIDPTSIDTKVAQRDDHLRSADFFEVDKYPTISFKSRRIEPLGGDSYKLVGDLTIRGVTHEVVLDATAGLLKDPWGNARVGFSGETTINRKDFGLVFNMSLETGGLALGEKARLNIEVELVKQA